MIQGHNEDMLNNLSEVIPKVTRKREHYHYEPKDLRDAIAKKIVHASAETATLLFQDSYGHRAIVLETIASVPGMVGGMFQHLKSLRFIRDDNGWIKTLLDEAENERIHLLVYSEIAKPSVFDRILIIIVQIFFCILYALLYILSPKTAHRVVGYFEEEAIHSYERYLELVEAGTHENIQATALAKKYWNLREDARLADVIEATILDEMLHRDVNHRFADDKAGTQMWH